MPVYSFLELMDNIVVYGEVQQNASVAVRFYQARYPIRRQQTHTILHVKRADTGAKDTYIHPVLKRQCRSVVTTTRERTGGPLHMNWKW
ncbi:hypothetical protein PR048_012655 [Dryococelus australis]|uniref:DUF4817 domain-containing protein n=1 Tax=Dryococelus australis TaxID=614101 RepID=A0ABQ9HQ07_9NEOP|nr:hypothetical protein PR048_012655 [Dryococelus australis]